MRAAEAERVWTRTGAARLFLVLAASCDAPSVNDGHPIDAARVDAARVDAAIDAVANDAMPVGEVRVSCGDHCRSGKAVFQNADASVVAIATIDANGEASAQMAAGGFVTIVPRDQFSRPLLTTFVAVRPGDVLGLGAVLAHPTTRTIDVTFPTLPGFTDYHYRSTCSSDAATVILPGPVEAGTATGPLDVGACPTADFVVQASRAGDPEGTKALIATNVDVAATVTVLGLYQAPQLSTVNITQLGPEIGQLYVGQHIFTPNGDVASDEGAVDLPGSMASVQLYPAASMRPDVKQHTDVGYDEAGAPGRAGLSSVAVWGPFDGTVEIDFAAVRQRAIMSVGTYDRDTRTLVWTEGPVGRDPDFAYALIDVERSAADGGPFSWVIVAPLDGPRITYPTLPMLQRDFNPGPADVIVGGAPTTFAMTVTGVTESAYDLARGHVLHDLMRMPMPGDSGVMARELWGG